MELYELIEKYGKGKGDTVMWETTRLVSDFIKPMKEANKKEYWNLMREIYCLMSGAHYNECFAREDVSKMYHKNPKGETIKGEHWNIDQITAAIKGMSIPSSTNIWDVYVALNANWHDKEVKFAQWFGSESDQRIIEDAINFYFMDIDAPDGKVWLYIDAMET